MHRRKKDYYVMDEILTDSSKDKFGHEEIANNIINLVTNNRYKSPYNIALIGKWGLGKTSILKLVQEKISQEKNMRIIFINAWKYEKETLKHIYLKTIYEEISGKKIDLKKQLENRLINIFAKKEKKATSNKKKSIKDLAKQAISTWGLPIIVSLIVSFIWQLCTYLSVGNTIGSIFEQEAIIAKYFRFYFDNIFVTFGVPLLAFILPNIFKSDNNILSLNINFQEDYETLLKEMMEKSETKFIIVIDDLDRLSTKKMVEALDTLKTLMEIKNCIFIVPFDDSILKKALEEQVIKPVDNDHKIIESELILDKLFQFRFYVPPLIISDMKEYALEIIKKESSDLYKLFQEEELEEIVKNVFVYDGLTTPRQVKKIINTFANNVILTTERIQSKKISQKLFDKEGKLLIAKISVLQSDFNDFYDDLFDEPEACEILLDINKKESKYKKPQEVPKRLQKYCEKASEDKIKIREKYNKLLNFLSRTAYINSKDITTYLYCNQDRMSFIYGSEFNRELIGSMRSLNFTNMNQIISSNPNKNIYNLLISYLESEPLDYLPNVITSILNIENFEFDQATFNTEYIASINRVFKSNGKFDMKNVNFKGLLNLNKYESENVIVQTFLNKYYDYLNDNIDSDDIEHDDIFSFTLQNLDNLTYVKTNKIKSYLLRLCTKDEIYVMQINNVELSKSNLKKYFGKELYNLNYDLLNESNEDEHYKIYSEIFIKLYNALKDDSENIQDINEKVINALDDSKNIKLCSGIIVNNLKYFSDEEQQIICEKTITLDNLFLENQFQIIDTIKFTLTTEMNENLQNKILEFIKQGNDIENIMNKIDDYSSINNVINNLNERVYNNSKLDIIYKNNINKFSDEQLNDLIGKLSKQINVNTYQEGRVIAIINIVGEYVSLDKIISCFTDDELIKSIQASNEIIELVNSNETFSEESIDNYIKRTIELLPLKVSKIIDLKKISTYFSKENIKLLAATINKELINKMDVLEKEALFNIFIKQEEKEYIENEIKDILNELLYTDIYDQVIEYMIKNDIKISNTVNFLFENINNIEKLTKYKGLTKILDFNESINASIIQKIYEKEYTVEQLSYLIDINDNILNSIKSIELKYDISENIFITNVLKIISKYEGEKKLSSIQSELILNGSEELLIDLLNKFEKISNTENRKVVKKSLQNRWDAIEKNTLLDEKFEMFNKKNRYYVKKNIKEKVMQ